MTETTKRVAMIACTICGERIELRKGKKGFLYLNCTPPDGCGQQTFSRSLAADKRLAARAENWNCPETRAALIPSNKPAAPAPAPAPAPEKPTTTKPKEKASSWLDMTL
jgi:hypothetical protein